MDNIYSNPSTIVIDSVRRQKQTNQEQIKKFFSELIDTYEGFSDELIKKEILDPANTDINSNQAKISAMLKKYVVAFNFLYDISNKLSKVYIYKPKRSFFKDGKRIVDELDPDMPPDDFIVDPDLLNTLEKRLYSKEISQKLKLAERLTNLCKTSVFKIYKHAGKMSMTFIPPDECTVEAGDADFPTKMTRIEFIKAVVMANNKVTEKTVEIWELPTKMNELETPMTAETRTNNKVFRNTESEETINEFAIEYNKMLKKNYPDEASIKADAGGVGDVYHAGDGFPPFVVFRSEQSLNGFWNVKDRDLIQNIKKLNVHLSWIMFLIKSSTAPIYVGRNIPAEAFDFNANPLAINRIDDGKSGAESIQASIEQLENRANIKDALDAIFQLIKLQYSHFGINLTDMVGSGNKSSAESKIIDTDQLRKMIEAQRDEWRINEENLFHTLVSVWNYLSKSNPIDHDIEMVVDFHDSQRSIDDQVKELDMDLLKMASDLTNPIELILKQNPDLTSEQARIIFEKNQSINSALEPEIELGIEGETEEPIEEPEPIEDNA